MATKKARSLRSELIRAFWIFGGLLVLLLAGIIVGGSIQQEDETLRRQLRFELDDYWQRHREALERGAAPPPVTSRFFRAHLGTETLPAALRELAAELPDGVHEMDQGPLKGGEDYFLAARTLSRRQERLYLVYDVRELDDEWREYGTPSFLLVALGGGVVVVFGLLAVSWLSRRVLAPITELERVLARHAGPEELARALAGRSDPPELASLSGALEASMRRIDAFVERERKFTRDASHELRTPVTVIRGATELLEQNPPPEKAARVLGRIRRAVDRMEDLIEAFLWMSREDGAGAAEWSTDLGAVVRDVVEHHRPLLADREVEVEVALEPCEPVAAPPQAVNVVVSNLVKNAFDSTPRGRVRLEAAGGRVRILNPGPAFDGAAGTGDRAHGFGLTIVDELCGRFGWRSTLTTDGDGGTVATVDFVS